MAFLFWLPLTHMVASFRLMWFLESQMQTPMYTHSLELIWIIFWSFAVELALSLLSSSFTGSYEDDLSVYYLGKVSLRCQGPYWGLPVGYNSLFVFLKDFLTLEGRGSEIQQVGSVLNHVKKHLPKAPVKKLNSWISKSRSWIEKMESICQARAKELDECLQQLLR